MPQDFNDIVGTTQMYNQSEIDSGFSKLRTNFVLVKSLSDFPTPVGGVITLVNNTTYEINGSVNIGTNTITVGISNKITGIDKSDDKLIYTGTSAMINGTNQDFTVAFITLAAITAGGSVFNLTGSTNNTQIVDCIFGSCASLGTIDGGSALSFDSNFLTSNSQGITIKGTFAKCVVADNVWHSNSGTITCISIPSGTFTLLKISRQLLDVAAGQTALNISTSVVVTSGVVENCDLVGAGTYLTGVSVRTPAWMFRVNRGIENTEVYLARAIDRNWMRLRATNGTVSSTGMSGGTLFGTLAMDSDTSATYLGCTTTNSAGGKAGVESGTSVMNETRPDMNPEYTAVIKTGSDVTIQRVWVGLVSATMTSTDNPSGSQVAFRYSTVAGDTGWTPIVKDGSTQTVGTTIGTVTANTQYKLKVRIDYPAGKCYFSVNGGAEQAVNAVPLSGTDMAVTAVLFNTATGQRTIRFSRAELTTT